MARLHQRSTKHALGATDVAPCVSVRPPDSSRAFREGAKAIDLAQQGCSSFTDCKAAVELDPHFATEREGTYARSNRLTSPRRRRTIMWIHPMSVHTDAATRSRLPILELIRASSLHVGAAAAAAALRRDLVDTGRLSSAAFDEAYAVARVTPGTNLLAMYTLLGERFAGWRGALLALGVGALVPAVIAVTLGAAYVEYADHPLAREAMQGARAGALAIFAWAVVRLLRPQLQQHRGRGVALSLGTLAMALIVPVPSFVILLVAGGVGAVFLMAES